MPKMSRGGTSSNLSGSSASYGPGMSGMKTSGVMP